MIFVEASGVAVGEVLVQKQDSGKFHPGQFGSHTMSAIERRYSTFEQEALAVLFALKKVPSLRSWETISCIQ